MDKAVSANARTEAAIAAPAPPPATGADSPQPAARLFKVIACEIAVRELCHVVARSPNLVDFEFLTQGYHDVPNQGRDEIQKRIDAVPAGKYDAILLGYGLCSNILARLTTAHTPLVIPRAHDCITFFLGSKERYRKFFDDHPGTYYYTSGWLECVRRRGVSALQQGTTYMPSNYKVAAEATYQQWVEKYGEEQAQYLREVMGGWSDSYGRGALISFEFTKALGLPAQVQRICADRGWQYDEVPGDLGLFERWVGGQWDEREFLIVQPGQRVVPSNDEQIVRTEAGNAAD